MKRIVSLLIVVVGIVFAGIVWANDIKVKSVSALPEASQEFLKKHFGAKLSIHEMEFDAKEDVYSVELRNGYEVNFNSKGKTVEVDSPDLKDISVDIVKDVLPAKAVTYLESEGLLGDIDEIEVLANGGYLVGIEKIAGDIDIKFDKDGNLLKRF